MVRPFSQAIRIAVVASVLFGSAVVARAANPSAADALKLKPVQADVDFDTPTEAEAEKCTIVPYQRGQTSGWEVRDPDGRVLRRFLDTNRDNKVDQWCYFKDGIEVYRDIDSDFNRKADEYRWLGTAGTRWGLDTNQDGQTDRWKVISPEEVSAEIVAALRTRDTARFRCLMLTRDELQTLKLGEKQAAQLKEKIAATTSGLDNMIKRQQLVDRKAEWVNFGGTRPGVVPAGTDGSLRDLEVYENTAAIVDSPAGAAQIMVGTLIRVGDAWRVIDLPQALSDQQAGGAVGGFFFQTALTHGTEMLPSTAGGLSPKIQQLVTDLESIDKDLATATQPDAIATLNAKRADVVEKLAATATTPADQATWVRQLADTVSAAVQAGGYPQGVKRIESMCERLKKQKADEDLIAYVQFRYLSARYGQSLRDPDADFAKLQQQWLDSLKQFVDDYPKAGEAAEAMLQLAIAEEFSVKEKEAVTWYSRITDNFASSEVARKAAGAKRRIESVGKTLTLQGNDLDGQTVSVAALRGKVVLVHYWATWCEPCKQALPLLEKMLSKYGKENLALIGVNINNQRSDLDAYLAENSLPWPQIYEPGGMDSRLATEMGVLTLPTMILIDKNGKVVQRNLEAADVDSQLRKLMP